MDLWTDSFWRAVDPETAIVGFQRAEPGWISPLRDSVQDDFDIWYVAAGTATVLVDGRWHALEPGDVFTIKPGSDFQQERSGVSDPYQIYWAHVLPFGRRDRGLNEKLAKAWPMRMSMLHQPELPRVFNQLFETYAVRPAGFSLAVKGLTLQLLHIIFEELRNVPSAAHSRSHLNILRAKELMESGYARDLRLRDIAKGCGLSSSHLSALFVRYFGVPPVEFLLRVRLREAKLLLAKGARVKDAAEVVGFHSQHYFSRLFKSRTGMSPLEFTRRQARR